MFYASFHMGELPDLLKQPHQTEDEHVVYLLPHEFDLMAERFRLLEEKHEVVAEIFAEAMGQSSESWHDNAPADAARDEAGTISWEVRQLAYIARNHQIVNFPEPESVIASIGSRVTLAIGSGEPFSIDIIGVSLFGRNVEDPDQDVDLVTYKAPLAHSVLGHKAGEIVPAQIGGNEVVLTLLEVDQKAQSASIET